MAFFHARSRAEDDFFACAGNFWAYRAYMAGSKAAGAVLSAWVASHPHQQLPCALFSDMIHGEKLSGAVLNALGFPFFRRWQSYNLLAMEEGCIAVWTEETVSSLPGDDVPLINASLLFLNDRLSPVQSTAPLRVACCGGIRDAFKSDHVLDNLQDVLRDIRAQDVPPAERALYFLSNESGVFQLDGAGCVLHFFPSPENVIGQNAVRTLIVPDGAVSFADGFCRGLTVTERFCLPDSLRALGPLRAAHSSGCVFANCRLPTVILPDHLDTLGIFAFGGSVIDALYLPRTLPMPLTRLRTFKDARIRRLCLPAGIGQADGYQSYRIDASYGAARNIAAGRPPARVRLGNLDYDCFTDETFED